VSQIAQIRGKTHLERLVVDLDGHRVHPNPDQINRVRCPIDLKNREMSELSYSFLIKSAIWDTHDVP